MKQNVILCVAVLAVAARSSPVGYGSDEQGYQQPTAGYQEASANSAYQENSHGDYKDVNRDNYNTDGQDYSSSQQKDYATKDEYQQGQESYAEGKDDYQVHQTKVEQEPKQFTKQSYNEDGDNQVAATASAYQKNQPEPYAPMNSPYHGFPYNYYPFRLYTGFYHHLPQGKI